jgi:hypothetical protein
VAVVLALAGGRLKKTILYFAITVRKRRCQHLILSLPYLPSG